MPHPPGYRGGWESHDHYKFWAQYLDSDWDEDTDPPARIHLAWELSNRNLETATTCLLDQWEEDAQHEAWAKGLELVSRPIATELEFEDLCLELLLELKREGHQERRVYSQPEDRPIPLLKHERVR